MKSLVWVWSPTLYFTYIIIFMDDRPVAESVDKFSLSIMMSFFVLFSPNYLCVLCAIGGLWPKHHIFYSHLSHLLLNNKCSLMNMFSVGN